MDECEREELGAQDRFERRQFNRLLRNPNPADPDYPIDLMGDVEPEGDDTHERLTECADNLQAWLDALRLALATGHEEKAWSALDELNCEANAMMESKP